MGAPTSPAKRVELVFDDNRAMALLLGEYDAHVSVIEQRLGIRATPIGNILRLEGAALELETAQAVLKTLYGRVKAGNPIVIADIEGALRLARAAPVDEQSAGGPTADDLRTRKRIVSARTPAQARYISALKRADLVFGTGPAGTGKTYLAVAYAAGCLERGEVERLILSRPAVEAGERLGFLPGDMRDKVDPYLRPLYDALYDVLPPEKVERGLESGTIEIAPLAFMRGRTLSHAIVLLDEAQNCTSMQMKMFLTRLGEGSKMVVTGDPSQIDLPGGVKSGLAEATALLAGIEGVAHVPFTGADVVRSALVARIVAAYEAQG